MPKSDFLAYFLKVVLHLGLHHVRSTAKTDFVPEVLCCSDFSTRALSIVMYPLCRLHKFFLKHPKIFKIFKKFLEKQFPKKKIYQKRDMIF
jgi:hypothetical protein